MTDLQNFVHRGGVLFADGLGNIENTRTGHILTHGYFNDIADLHIIRRAGYFAVALRRRPRLRRCGALSGATP